MSPEIVRPVRRAPRGSARFIAGLALLAVIVACSSSDDVTGDGSIPAPAPTAPTEGKPASPQQKPATTPSSDATAGSKKPPKRKADGIDGPYTLRIARIGLAAPVVPIQSNKDRVLNPPRDPSVAGWWSQGAAPGEPKGSAVLVGHTVRNNGGGVFDDIEDLSRGDAIEVKGSDSALTYRVRSVDVLSKDQVARNAEEIFDQTGAGRLVIITCDDWDGTGWRSNIVTIAAPIS